MIDIGGESFEKCGFCYTLSVINGRYKMPILYTLATFGVVRFNEMRRYLGKISFKTLSTTLKELEADKLVHREEYPQIPPKVEYSLTERGETLIPILDLMCNWGTRNRLPSEKEMASLIPAPPVARRRGPHEASEGS